MSAAVSKSGAVALCTAVTEETAIFCSSESQTCWQRMNLLHIFKCEPVDRQEANAL